MSLSKSDKQLIFDYIFYHYHSPQNTNPEDYRHFNQIMFRAIKLNFIYTLSFSAILYQILHRSPKSILKSYTYPGYTLSILLIYSGIQYTIRLNKEIYSLESLNCAKKYATQVEEYNDHFRRIYGNT